MMIYEGQIIGKLTVIRSTGCDKRYHKLFLCLCQCGTEKVISYCALMSGRVKSCGCLRKEQNKTLGLVHGESNKSKEWTAWSNMKSRCYDKNRDDYKDYGGRGITVCESWRNSYAAFLLVMGRAPSSKHSLDRINNEGNYEPGNCKWATWKEQANNRRPRSKRKKEIKLGSWQAFTK